MSLTKFVMQPTIQVLHATKIFTLSYVSIMGNCYWDNKHYYCYYYYYCLVAMNIFRNGEG
jgi:hypothetical protein